MFLTLVVYARSLTLGLVYDDHVIFDKPWILSWKGIPKLFTEDLITDHASNFYRPLAVFWHGLVYRVAGTNPAVWHAGGVLLHVVCVLLVFRLACKLLKDRGLAAFAAAVFAVHPTHVEAVSWVSDAADPLMTAVILLSALAFLRWLDTGAAAWWTASWLLAFACCFVKETGVLMPALLLVLAVGTASRVSRPAIMLTGVAFLLSSCAFLVLRSHVLHGFAHPLSSAGNRELILTLPAAVCFYLSHLVLPVRLGPTYPLVFVSDWRSAAFLLPALLLTAVLVIVAWLFRRASDRRLCWICAAWTLVPLAAPLYLKLFPEFELVHDRYLYIPTIGLGVALVAGLKKLSVAVPERENAVRVAVAVLLIALAVATISYQGVWQSDLTLFERAIELTPRNARALVNLGVAKLQQDNFAEGTALLKRALEIQPDNAFALFDLGNAALRNGDAITAERYFERALELEAHFNWWVLLANARFNLGKLPQAEFAVRQALAIDPAGRGAHVLLGGLRLAQGDSATAVREFNIELRINPADRRAQELLGLAQQQLAQQHN